MANESLLRPWIKICLFLVSYFPLFVIMAVLHYDHNIILYSIMGVSIIGFTGLGITFYVLNRVSGEYKEATKIEPASKINFQYFLAYIIPFITIDIDSTRQLVAYSILFIFIGILYVKTELIYVNPTLVMFGYKLLKIHSNNESIMLITKNDLDHALENPVVTIGSDLYYERRK